MMTADNDIGIVIVLLGSSWWQETMQASKICWVTASSRSAHNVMLDAAPPQRCPPRPPRRFVRKHDNGIVFSLLDNSGVVATRPLSGHRYNIMVTVISCTKTKSESYSCSYGFNAWLRPQTAGAAYGCGCSPGVDADNDEHMLQCDTSMPRLKHSPRKHEGTHKYRDTYAS